MMYHSIWRIDAERRWLVERHPVYGRRTQRTDVLDQLRPGTQRCESNRRTDDLEW